MSRWELIAAKRWKLSGRVWRKQAAVVRDQVSALDALKRRFSR